MKAFIALSIIILAGCVSTGTQNQTSKVQDPYSVNCSSGTFAVFNGSKVICEPPRLCENDSDCAYLDVDGLPPRQGQCIFGTCKAACGSGLMRVCVN